VAWARLPVSTMMSVTIVEAAVVGRPSDRHVLPHARSEPRAACRVPRRANAKAKASRWDSLRSFWLDELSGQIWGLVAGVNVGSSRMVPLRCRAMESRATHVAPTSGGVPPILRGGRLWLDESAGGTCGVVAGEDVSSSRTYPFGAVQWRLARPRGATNGDVSPSLAVDLLA
jgi:hypothetical protein